MAAVGRKRAFRLLVTFVSVSMRIGAVCAPDKFNFGQRMRELGFVEDVKRFVVILPDDKRARLIAWLAEVREHRSAPREEFNRLVHTLVSVAFVIPRGKLFLNRFFKVLSQR